MEFCFFAFLSVSEFAEREGGGERGRERDKEEECQKRDGDR